MYIAVCYWLFSFFSVTQTFEAKLLHLESRPGRKTKNSLSDDLEFFMKCEVHSSDIDIFINSLKRVVDDVRTVQDEKRTYDSLNVSKSLVSLEEDMSRMYYCNISIFIKCVMMQNVSVSMFLNVNFSDSSIYLHNEVFEM